MQRGFGISHSRIRHSDRGPGHRTTRSEFELSDPALDLEQCFADIFVSPWVPSPVSARGDIPSVLPSVRTRLAGIDASDSTICDHRGDLGWPSVRVADLLLFLSLDRGRGLAD